MIKHFIMMASVLMLVGSGQVMAVTQYTITDLGTLGGSISESIGINNSGQVVGQSYLTGDSAWHAFLYEGNTMKDLGTLGGSLSRAFGINNSGQIVGDARITGDSAGHAFLYEGNTMKDLGSLGGRSGSWATGINDSGLVVGGSWITRDVSYHAFLYEGNTMKDLGSLGGGWSRANGINNSGQVVGDSTITGVSDWHAFLYEGNTMKDLGTLGGSWSLANGINDSGQVVGDSTIIGDSDWHAFLYEGNTMKDLGSLGGDWSRANGINNSGQVVGYTGTGAFLYDGGKMIDLNALLPTGSGWVLESARSINDSGQIIGWGHINGSNEHAFLMTPVPEPAVPPVANANGPYTIYVGDTLTLDASGSTDYDNDIVSYLWDLDDNNSFETDAGDQPVFDVNFDYLQSIGLIVDNTYNIHLKVTDGEGLNDVNDSTLTILPMPALQVFVDIKPGSCPNPVNVKSSGVLPVAILGTNDYDITRIDPTSIRLAGVEPLRSGYEDVAGPVPDSNDCNCTEDGPDSFLDLTLKFKTQKIVDAIGDVNEGDVLRLELTGILLDPIPFETPIEGGDCILIRGRHKPFNMADINKDGVVNPADFAIFAQNWLQSSVAKD